MQMEDTTYMKMKMKKKASKYVHFTFLLQALFMEIDTLYKDKHVWFFLN